MPKKIYLIDRDFQLKYVKLAVLVGFLSTVMTMVMILYPLFEFQILRFPNFVPAPFIWGMGLAAVLNLATVACLGVLITHRIAGPMFSLVRHFRTLVQTSRFTADLKVRDSDDMKYVVRNFNELVAHFRGLTESDRDRLKAMIEALRRQDTSEALKAAELLESELATRVGAAVSPDPVGGMAP